MDSNASQAKGAAPQRWLGAAGLLGAGLLAGGILAGSLSAGAATSSTASSSSTGAATGSAPAAPGTSMDPATVGHGPGETLLTGTVASKVTAAAKAAVPGATIIRVETDSDGAAYEAHVQKADGSYVTVKLDTNFKVTSTVGGFGGGAPRNASGTGA
jgi:hypothetical protein